MKNLNKLTKLLLLPILFTFLYCFQSIAVPYVTVLSPNGGENWMVGSNNNITWNYTGTMPTTVKIEYSTNNGQNWNLIVSGINVYSGTYQWTVTGPSSNQCLVRITENYFLTSDVSNGVFTIFNQINVNPTFLSHWELPLGSSVEDLITVTNPDVTARNIITTTFIPVDPPNFNNTYQITQNPAPVLLPGQGSVQIKTQIVANNIGNFSVNFKIATSQSTADTQIVSIWGEVINPIISVNRSKINFGNLLVGTQKKWDTVKVKNIGTTVLYINSVNFALQVSPFELVTPPHGEGGIMISPNDSILILVGFNPTQTGSFSDVLTIRNNSINSPNLTIPVDAAVSIPANISLNKSSINFGSSGYLTSSKDSTIIITNTSTTQNLTISQLYFNDADSAFQVLNIPPIIIPSNNNYTVNVRFLPSEVGNHQSNLHIINTSSNNPDATVSVTGSVIGSTISASPTIINFGNIGYQSDPIDTVIAISNTGNYSLKINASTIKDSSFIILSQIPPSGILISKGNKYDLKIRFSPNQLGTRSDTLKVQNNSSNSPSLPVRLSGNVLLPNLTITPSRLDFGTASVNTPKITKTLAIKNTGAIPITITGKILFSDTVSFHFILNNLSITLSPNQTDSVKIEFFPRSSGSKIDTLKIVSNDPLAKNRYIVMTGTGSGKPILFSSLNSINFGDVIVGQSKDTLLIIKNNGNLDLNLTNLSIIGNDKTLFSIVGGTTAVIESGNSDTIKIRIAGALPIGNKAAQLQIINNDVDNSSFKIDLIAFIKSPIINANLSRIVYDTTNVGSFRDSVLLIKNTGNANLSINSIDFDGTHASEYSFYGITIPGDLIPNEEKKVYVRFTPLASDLRVARILFHSNDPLQPDLAVILRGYGRSVAKPVISLSTNSLNFGYSEANTSKDSSFMIKNIGGLVLRVDSLNIQGINKSLFSFLNNLPPYNINPGDSLKIIIRFFPKSTDTLNPLTAQVRIISNDPDHLVSLVSLSGGLAKPSLPSISILDTIIDFGDVVIFDTTSKEFRISNDSFAILRIDSIYFDKSPDQPFSLNPISLPISLGPGTGYNVGVIFNPKSKISYQSYLNIRSNDKSQDPFRIKVIGNTVTPQISVIPDSVDFGKIPYDTGKDTLLYIKNTGDGNLLIKDLVVSGDTSGIKVISSPVNKIINPGSQFPVGIRFLINNKGDKKITIRLYTNVYNKPSIDIMVKGKGVYPIMNLPPQVSFGKSRLNISKDFDLVISNSGEANLVINDMVILGSDSPEFTFIKPIFPFIIGPNKSNSITFKFLPVNVGKKNARLLINSNDPFNTGVLNIDAEGTTQNLVVNKNSIDFGNVTISKSKIDTLIIQNQGTDPITINGIQITGLNISQFSFVDSIPKTPFVLNTSDSKTIKIAFSPDSIGIKNANIEINTADQQSLKTTISLTGKGITPTINVDIAVKDFGSVKINNYKDSSIVISNTGEGILIIKQIYLSSGDTNGFKILSSSDGVEVQPGKNIPLLIRFNPKSFGSKKSNIVIKSNDFFNSTISFQLKGFAPSITLTTDVIAEENKDKTISFHVEGDNLPSLAKIFFKKGSGKKYDSSSLVYSPLTDYSYTFIKDSITKYGLDFYGKFTWDGTEVTLPDTNYITHPFSLQIEFKNLNDAFQLFSSKYSMVTVPLQFQGTTLLYEFIRNLGPINNSVWRIFKWRNNDYNEYISENNWQIGVADGFWLIAKSNKFINFENCITIPTNAPYKITLRPGWNQVGNPFLFPVSTSGIIIPTGKKIENVLWGWAIESDDYSMEENAMNPFVGYFIKNNEPDNVDISISPLLYQSTMNKEIAREKSFSLQSNEWKIIIEMKHSAGSGSSLSDNLSIPVEFGFLQNSNDEWDLNDVGVPPPAPEIKDNHKPTIQMRFPHNDWNDCKGNYIRDFRAISKEGNVWDMEVNSNPGSGNSHSDEYELRFTLQGNLPNDFQINLFDCDKQSTVRGNSEYTYKFSFNNNQPIKKFKIIVGTKEYNENESRITDHVPREYSLSQNYPNPFNPSTRIEYTLPENSYVNIKIFNTLGQEVETLMNGYQPIGRYSLDWHPNSAAGGLPSGVYYYRLQTEKFTETRKMMYLR